MVDDVGSFKVVIEGEISPKLGDNLEKGLRQSSEKSAKTLQKEIEKALDKGVERAKKFESHFKIPSFGQIGEKLTSFVGQSAKSVTSAGLASTGGGEGMLALVSKLSIVVGALMLIYDVLKSLAPIQAILKMITTILQITLYPIAHVLLSIFKPIMIMLLKYVIIPFYNIFGEPLKMSPEAQARVKGFKENWWKEFFKELGITNFEWPDISKMFVDWINGLSKIEWPNISKIFFNWMDSLSKIQWPSLGIISGIIYNWIWHLAEIEWPNISKMFVNWINGLSKIEWPNISKMFVGWINGLSKIEWPSLGIIFKMIYDWVWNLFKIQWPSLGIISGIIYDWIWKMYQVKWPSAGEILLQIFTWLINFPKFVWPTVVDILTVIYNAVKEQLTGVKVSPPYSDSGGGGGGGGGGSPWGNSPWGNNWGNGSPPQWGEAWDNSGMATGGIVTKPIQTTIGESGPEAVIPLPGFLSRGMNSLSDLVSSSKTYQKLNSSSFSSPTIIFNIDRVEKEVDIDSIVQKIERTLYVNLKRSGSR